MRLVRGAFVGYATVWLRRDLRKVRAGEKRLPDNEKNQIGGKELIITINDRYRIRTDSHQFILESRAEPKEGVERKSDGWAPVAYLGRLNEVFDVLWRREIFAMEGEYPPEALGLLADSLDRLHADVNRALNG